MKTLFQALSTVMLFCVLSINAKAQGVINTPTLLTYQSNCGNVNLYSYTNICSLAVGSVVTATIDYGDGSPLGIFTKIISSTPCDSIVVSEMHTYLTGATYTPIITVTEPSSNTATQSGTIVIALCDNISGYVYIDANNNCIKDASELVQPNISVSLLANNNYIQNTTTDASGFYNFVYANNSTVNYKVAINECLSFLSCGVSYATINIVTPNTTNANFGFNSSITNQSININNVTTYPYGNCASAINFATSSSIHNMVGTNAYTYAVNFGDGNSYSGAGNYYSNSVCDGGDTFSFNHVYAAIGTYTYTLTITSGATVSNTYTNTVTIASSCGVYSGYVYGDANINCTKDVGEAVYQNIALYLRENGNYVQYANTDINGYYELNFNFIAGNTYTIQRFTNNLPSASCATNTIYTLTTANVSNLNFGLSTLPSVSILDSSNYFQNCGMSHVFFPQINGYLLSAANTYTLTIDFGDGITNTQTSNTLNYINGNYSSLQIGLVNHTYASVGTYTVVYTVTSSSGIIGTSSATKTATVCGNYSGNVYVDGNANCSKDAGEQNYTNGYVVVSNNGNNLGFGYLDNLGNYSIDFPFIVGQIYITEFIVNNWNNACYNVSCPITLTYANTLQTVVNLDFGVNINSSAFDLYTTYMNPMAPNGFDAGNTYNLYTHFGNYLCGAASGSVSITLDPNVTFISSTTTGYTVVGNVITWPAVNVSANSWNNSVYLTINVPFLKANNTPFVIGDSICITSSIVANIAGDVNPANNSFTKCFIIGTAYDPNDKEVSPKGLTSEGIVAQNQTLEYTIHFQNTGTAPAQTVIVRDTIDANLDINTMEVIASSHFMNTTKFGKAIAFTFPNIMLPDSNVSKEKSMGFVKYSIKPNLGLPIATKVKNVASIYFDVNPAIVTSIIKNQLGAIPDGVNTFDKTGEIFITPNPANELIQIDEKNGEIKNANIEIYNIMGQIVMQQLLENNNEKMDISKLANGVYTIKLVQNNQLQILKFIKN